MPRVNYIEPIVMLATVMQWLVLATITGAIVGSGTSLFLHGLFFLTGKTASIPLWLQMTLLPLGGFLNGLLLHYGYRKNTSGLKDSVIAAVHKQSGQMPFKTLAIKPIAAIITLACGGSAGKEGPCSHIGGSLASGVGRVLGLNSELQKRIVACGVSAGFASVFGTPIAGAIYGVEVLAIGRIRHDFLFPAIVAGVTSFEVSKLWGVPYKYYSIQLLPHFSETLFIKTIAVGIICGIVAWVFVDLIGLVRLLFSRLRTRFNMWPPIMPLLGGIVLSALIFFISTDYLGLSLPLMDRALDGEAMPYLGFFWKTLLVAITLGSGFYGGIVTPQFVIGAIAGNAFAPMLGISPSLGAAVGLVAVVAAASNTPVAAVLMGIELFGGTIGTVYVAGAGIAAYLIIGHRSVYPDQLVAYSKTSWMRVRPDMPLGQEKIHLSYGLLKWWSRFRFKRAHDYWRYLLSRLKR
ncbi:chloride channel protein [Paralcaligenes sp. KSB-10]|uniref:chloride channel protein n=1 Tax=Paralcaligenes sp. KSB-10 TaxID=2901142 RepID=UPI001E5B63F2|nr:chloride channel protein [Paralcaligenes sp. KSB-10]UHL63088.1 chloride channel protein [Paralcaligenes sp. KSB-10]